MPLRAFFLCRTSCPGGGLPLSGEAKPRLTGAPPARGVPCPSQTRQSLGSPGHPLPGGHPAPLRRGKASVHRGTLPGRRPLPDEAKPRLTGAPCPGGGLLTGAPCPGGTLPLPDEAKPRLTGAPPAREAACPSLARQSLGSPGHPAREAACPSLARQSLGSPGHPARGVPCPSQTRQSLGSPGHPARGCPAPPRRGKASAHRGSPLLGLARIAAWVGNGSPDAVPGRRLTGTRAG